MCIHDQHHLVLISAIAAVSSFPFTEKINYRPSYIPKSSILVLVLLILLSTKCDGHNVILLLISKP